MSPNHEKEWKFCKQEGCTHLPVKIRRDINPFADLLTLLQIIRHFKTVKPDIINVGTPKMGFLGILAAWIIGLPNRIYTCRGHRFEAELGFKKWLLIKTELLTIRLASRVVYVSFSLLDASKMYKTGLLAKSLVIGQGSSNGVNLKYFNKENIDCSQKELIERELKIQDSFVFGYIGRISARKGVNELISAFTKLHMENSSIVLILIGHLNCEKWFEEKIRAHPGIRYLTWKDNIPLYMSLFDIFVLPSRQEGFSNVLIQAAAMSLPVISTEATGCRDAFKPNFNGLLVPVNSPQRLAEAMDLYIKDEKLREQHSRNSRVWAERFRSEIIWEGLDSLYQSFETK